MLFLFCSWVAVVCRRHSWEHREEQCCSCSVLGHSWEHCEEQCCSTVLVMLFLGAGCVPRLPQDDSSAHEITVRHTRGTVYPKGTVQFSSFHAPTLTQEEQFSSFHVPTLPQEMNSWEHKRNGSVHRTHIVQLNRGHRLRAGVCMRWPKMPHCSEQLNRTQAVNQPVLPVHRSSRIRSELNCSHL